VAGQKRAVRRYWEEHPCGADGIEAECYSAEYFQGIEQRRRKFEPIIDSFADFRAYGGRRVLEVGVGTGTDFVRFARRGAELYGIDLTRESIRQTRHRLDMEGLDNARLQIGDSENLSFPAASFDLVYSWGVLHHTPSLSKAMRELVRVLRPGGELKLMLYHRHSIAAYWTWIRFALFSGRPWKSLRQVLADHVESPGTVALTRHELASMVATLPLTDVQIKSVLTWCDRGERSRSLLVQKVLSAVSQLAGDRKGWFLLLRARRM